MLACRQCAFETSNVLMLNNLVDEKPYMKGFEARTKHLSLSAIWNVLSLRILFFFFCIQKRLYLGVFEKFNETLFLGQSEQIFWEGVSDARPPKSFVGSSQCTLEEFLVLLDDKQAKFGTIQRFLLVSSGKQAELDTQVLNIVKH